ncbi:hypothetical protein ACPZ19_21660 [Amycolatopsis lurida]
MKIDLDKLRAHREAALRAAAGGKNPLLAELAREVQAGRITLRDAAGSSAYRDAFAEAAGGLLKKMRHLSIEDIRKAAEEQSLDEAIAGLVPDDPPDEEPPRRRPSTDTPDADDYFDRPIMEAPPTTHRGDRRR